MSKRLKPTWERDGHRLYLGDCLDVMPFLSDVDTVVTDPPYGLGFMGKDWDCPGGVGNFPMRRTTERNTVNTGASRQGGRQRGCEDWAKRQAKDMAVFQEWCQSWAETLLSACKPGAILLAFGGTRTFHRLTCAIEDAGWEVRDCLMWLYGQGFPKSLDVSKAIDKAAGAERKVLSTRQKRGALGGVAYAQDAWTLAQANQPLDLPITAPATELAKLWDGWGTALKPAWEPVVLAMKPLDGTFAENAEKHGVAGLNIDKGRVSHVEPCIAMNAQTNKFVMSGNGKVQQGGRHKPTLELKPSGRWPANVIHDGSDEVLTEFPETGISSGARVAVSRLFGVNAQPDVDTGYGDSGSAARFFYCAKASRRERGEFNSHPTVKPLALMRYLVRLTKTPTGGTVLDPFMGSGTTGLACIAEGRRFIGIERDPESFEMAVRRMEEALDAKSELLPCMEDTA